MKGLTWILWLTITLIIMGVMGLFILQAVSGFLGESLANSAKLTGQRIEAIVNDLEASPSGTVHGYQLPRVKGQLAFRGYNLGVRVSANIDRFYNNTHFIERYPIHYENGNSLTLDFDPQNRDVFFARCGDEIFIGRSKDKIPCVR
jgi:hypothetical protein